jgi:hypothetical protein
MILKFAPALRDVDPFLFQDAGAQSAGLFSKRLSEATGFYGEVASSMRPMLTVPLEIGPYRRLSHSVIPRGYHETPHLVTHSPCGTQIFLI